MVDNSNFKMTDFDCDTANAAAFESLACGPDFGTKQTVLQKLDHENKLVNLQQSPSCITG